MLDEQDTFNVNLSAHRRTEVSVEVHSWSFVSDVELQAEKCGYDKFLNEALTLSPPKGVKFPSVPNPKREGCVVEDEIACAVYRIYRKLFMFRRLTILRS
ncbi:hypothetical protein EYZ11_004787 [Aspergillus tanneri]|uniref:Uncharacterized protein n=1 Tax=Aspergillus tanneri TaxID=1220188 RepID=A0A4S3JM11_9EURO|nr:hypothetical protein EYZ11_004787 [Aspergillus tanneri]